ncbi:transcriptional regulator NrdR [Nanoarchaeota archaeon]
MKCPYCSFSQTKVIDSRESPDLNSIRRRRECLRCNKRITSYERVESVDLIVVKKDKRREQFDRNKLIKGFQKACEKRPIPTEKIDVMTNQIENDLRSINSTEIESSIIGDMVMKKLRKLDKIAYIRFASVYREFDDINTFERELKRIS